MTTTAKMARPMMTVGPCPDCGVAMDYGDLRPDSDEVICDTCAGCTTTVEERAVRDIAIAVLRCVPPQIDGTDDGRPFEDDATIDVFVSHGAAFLVRVGWRDGALETFVWDPAYPDCIEIPADTGPRWVLPPQCAVVADPDPGLVALLRDGCDGGGGEYDTHLPPWCVDAVDRLDATYAPALNDEGGVDWSII